MTTCSSPNKITFVMVDIIKTSSPKTISPSQPTSSTLSLTDIAKQTTTEIITAQTSNVTPPPPTPDHTPLDKKEVAHKDTETVEKADYGPKKRLSFEYKGDNRE
ncbi:hypothetical protein L2E82_08313 [Cichorium intybus]|uniref:Uncharacterized protein n=1 Tax=Cichorium intybus TaxID=13427 RepID=A0ACB9G680_CICIN|nr:hypothetical protein L2E82_08313 [Cichorium intybus]